MNKPDHLNQPEKEGLICPCCNEPYHVHDKYAGKGFAYKSKFEILGIPFIHISFRYLHNNRPIPAKGIIAIGQFAAGVVTISQFGVGLISISQFALAGYALSQIAVAYKLIAQLGIYIEYGIGQSVWRLPDLFHRLLDILPY